MGAQTRDSLQQLAEAARSHSGVASAAVSGLFEAGHALQAYPSLLSALADPGHEASERRALIDQALAQLDEGARALLAEVSALSWSKPADLLVGVQTFAVRLVAVGADVDQVVSQLLGFSRVVRSHAELQLALSDKRQSVGTKRSIIAHIGKKALDSNALLVVEHIASAPGRKRASEALIDAARIVLDQGGRSLAEVQVAAELSSSQLQAVASTLDARFGRPHYLDVVVDPEVIGGIRIQVGDVVIDASIARQLHDMRLQLAS